MREYGDSNKTIIEGDDRRPLKKILELITTNTYLTLYTEAHPLTKMEQKILIINSI